MRLGWAVFLLLAGTGQQLTAGDADGPLGGPAFVPSPQHPAGWRGDGTGLFPGATPPLAWGDGTGWRLVEEPDGRGGKRKVSCLVRDAGNVANIRWHTLLPNWSNASPIVVGHRVFVMAEPVDCSPLLLCLDSHTGAILWRKEVNHLDAVPGTPAEIVQVKKEWSAYHVRKRLLTRLAAEKRNLDSRLKAAPEDAGLKTELEKWTIQARAAGTEKVELTRDIGGLNAKVPGVVSPEQDRRLRELAAKYGCHFLPWEANVSKDGFRGSAYVGSTHSTPVSDGRCVYVLTGYNCAACFDLEGHLKWLKWLGPWRDPRVAGWMDFTQSPVLIRGRLLVATKKQLTALDATTGQIVWQTTIFDEYSKLTHGYDCLLLTGVPLRLAGTDYFLWYDGRVYRVQDGKPMTERLIGKESLYHCCCPVALNDTVYLVSHEQGERGKQPHQVTAIRLEGEDGEQLGHRALWRQPLAGRGGAYTGLVWDGKLYLPVGGRPGLGSPPQAADKEFIYDLATGQPAGESWLTPDHLSGVLLAGKHLVTTESIRSGQCRMRFYDLTGKMLSENYLSSLPATGERLNLIRSETGRDSWHDGHYHGSFHSVPFFQGDRIYIRSRDELICVGPAIKGGTTP